MYLILVWMTYAICVALLLVVADENTNLLSCKEGRTQLELCMTVEPKLCIQRPSLRLLAIDVDAKFGGINK